MPFWVQLVLNQLIKYVADQITPEVVAKYEHLAAAYAVAALRKVAADTTQTDVDDKLVEIVAKALNVK